jgi:alpha/beta superfamily hydrolase
LFSLEPERFFIMKFPRETKPAVWGAVAGAVAMTIVGFSWGGWVTGGTAGQMAKTQADAAVVAAIAPICVENFQQQPDAVANLAALKETSTYQQAGFIEKGGWATMAGAERPHSGTARACAEMLRSLTVQ